MTQELLSCPFAEGNEQIECPRIREGFELGATRSNNAAISHEQQSVDNKAPAELAAHIRVKIALGGQCCRQANVERPAASGAQRERSRLRRFSRVAAKVLIGHIDNAKR